MQATEHTMNLMAVIGPVDFPVTKVELTESAIENNASQEAVSMVRALPNLTYNSLEELNADIGEVAKLPGNDNIWESTEPET